VLRPQGGAAKQGQDRNNCKFLHGSNKNRWQK
jgi:hypothetical protein